MHVTPLVRATEWDFPQATWITGTGNGMGTRLHIKEMQVIKIRRVQSDIAQSKILPGSAAHLISA